MSLLPEQQLIWSPVVVNSRMNRERNASGINSYEQEFKFKPEAFLADKITANGRASWLDLCCGYGKALIQVAGYFEKLQQQSMLTLRGVDLVDTFLPLEKEITCLQFETGSLTDYVPDRQYDLITCVHGLHYLGDKLTIIERAVVALNPGGLFIANLDLSNISIEGVNAKSFLDKSFKQSGLVYHSRRKMLSCTGPRQVHFPLVYLGADDEQGPNYTGQDAVGSHYRL